MPAEITVDELAAALDEGVWVLDVREVEEFEAGHVPNALHIPLSTIPENTHLIVEHETLYVICKAGGRSMKAATYLEAEVTAAVVGAQHRLLLLRTCNYPNLNERKNPAQ